MPTHSLLPFVDSPDGLLQDILISNNAGIPGPGCSMTPQSACTAKAVLQSEDSVQLSCMFCDQAFTHQDELGPHVLTHHPTTFYEPTVLRVDAEFRVPGERSRPKPTVPPVQEEAAAPSCIVCGQVAHDASELETHMRKHKDYFTYCCNICGRRFRESWFLKNHMKMHVKPGPKSRAVLDQEAPFTINGVTQEPSLEPMLSVYKMCMVCGFFFPDHDSLAEHSKVHNREAELGKDEGKEKIDGATEFHKQNTFLCSLNLQPASENKSLNNARSSKWIPQLDPFTTYQAWQLATKGKIAVGPNNTKDIGQELSTDNEDCGSDKEEMSVIWSESQGDKTVKELRSQPQSATETSNPPRRSLMQKHKDKERPTTCEECHKTFRTYHQLVLHSRVHKRERGGEDSPTSSADVKTPRTVSQDPAEETHEEALEENLISGEDGLDRSKYRSKECSYCGKSFRSSYYLTVHMRTHTGEKPYKCVYCNYAAAQKTSLKYHYDRRHKDKRHVEGSSRSVPLLPSPDGSPAPSRPKLWDSKANGTPEVRFDSLDIKPDKHIVQLKSECNDVQVEQPLAVNLKKEKEERNENSEAPLNLSLKVSVSIVAEARCALTPNLCSFCTYKTLYPEVLIMHKRLIHKDKSDNAKKNEYGGNVKLRRYTGCPPALEGKDVTPLQMTDRRHPRRTKSPLPQPSKPPEVLPVNQPHGPKCSPVPTAGRDVTPVFKPCRQNAESHPNQESSRYTEVTRKTNTGSKYVADRTVSLDRVGVNERSYPSRSGAFWHSDAARLCLSSRFGSLPQVDFGDPSGKRLKLSVPTNRALETGEKASFRPPPLDGPSRLLLPGRNTPQGPGPSSSSEALYSIKTGSASLGGSLESEWNMMNFLHYTPNDLASLYHSTPTNPSHGGLANPRVGARSLLFQPLPSLPSLPRRDPSTSFPHQRYGTTDKNS
ncbi:zinc finger protein 217 [Gambusia affinis]|uniref:zinc finger protein 217 n=1 Tax=Gambusia affinis TaxID=33528 RepID=UPI001CDC1E3A|nr:zinc finger protein 217 [Gambusia affinis]XP_043973331.1 zinc finger protein 217 [Gambusia affinis]XP_043973339.1 zinc finger protein 217 [Gambusia affinis]XP_043973344.1 zinc finger protein 217 [Gambusia affinis]